MPDLAVLHLLECRDDLLPGVTRGRHRQVLVATLQLVNRVTATERADRQLCTACEHRATRTRAKRARLFSDEPSLGRERDAAAHVACERADESAGTAVAARVAQPLVRPLARADASMDRRASHSPSERTGRTSELAACSGPHLQ